MADSGDSALECELILSIQDYQSQIEEVSETLARTTCENDRKQLEELQMNLAALLELTLKQLEEKSSSSNNTFESPALAAPSMSNDSSSNTTSEAALKEPSTSKHSSKVDEEFEKFMAMVSEIEAISSQKKDAEIESLNSESKKDPPEITSAELITTKSSNANLGATKSSDADLESSKEKTVEISQLDETNSSRHLEKDESVNAGNSENNENNYSEREMEISSSLEAELQELEGENVRAPYREKWGGFSYHNAVVLSVVKDSDNNIGLNPEVLVLFSQPTCLAMLTCRFFLNGRCKFTSENCKFSHGVPTPINDLKDYEEPDRDKIVSGSEVLALHDGEDLWHRGKVEDVLDDRESFSLDCSVCKKVVEVDISAMVPVYSHDTVSSSIQSSNNQETRPNEEPNSIGEAENRESEALSENPQNEAIEDETSFVPHEAWLANPLDVKLGAWEKHTKGIGSKLMSQMGYVVGTGLGPRGDGRVNPVDTLVYPQGVSLDHCMRLREAGGSSGECLLTVEKRLLKRQKKIEEKLKKQSDNLSARTSVFDIINKKLGNEKATENHKESPNISQPDLDKDALKNMSMKDLNKKNFQLGSQISKLKVELQTLKTSKSRHTSDPVVSQFVDSQLRDKVLEYKVLQRTERLVEKERQKRVNMLKFCTF